ncbi:sir2 family histone deacetylase [Grosmannia clavigera kw1407]|uniref:Sir2 family histone deacetylase n=1 Tax=Grosmannia clavigera (strain kw1407 / UAMH 11150) TaxID=655863 RepID=F0XKY6_GROCL|nr:sir2 family histone deacetylase [Grosmannia clavigera kw1407]EFX01664.1 sir2 family histone deacetylase [Grosmannia clavigera kw1407]
MDDLLLSAASPYEPSSTLPSSPLTDLSRTPSPPSSPVRSSPDPPTRYPSPSMTSQSGCTTPRKTHHYDAPRDPHRRGDSPPPAKRRRVQTPRPRMTRHVDLANPTPESEEELSHLIQALQKKKKIVVIAGAGISVSAGIPDFRSSTGLFTTLREQHGIRASGKHLFDASVYKHDASTSSFHAMVRELAHLTQKARPTSFHHMLASIATEGRLMRLYSQNIDGIDTALKPLSTTVPLNSKGPWPVTIQLHGGLEKMVCSKCGNLESFDGSRFDGPEPPECDECAEIDKLRTSFAGKRSHGIGRLRPRIVLYNEYNPDEEAIGNVSRADLRRGPDAVIVVGTSLKIPGVRRLVKELCQVTRSRRDGMTAWINVDNEPQGAEFKECWDTIVRGSCDDIARLANLRPWDQPDDIGSPSKWLLAGYETHADSKLEVVLESSPLKKSQNILGNQIVNGIKVEESAAEEKAKKAHTSSPIESIPTPIPSPKPARKRLPEQRKASSAQQSQLPFQQIRKSDNGLMATKGVESKEDTKPAVESLAKRKGGLSSSAKPPKKQRQPKGKKDAKPSKINIATNFRKTKNTSDSTLLFKTRKPLPIGKPKQQDDDINHVKWDGLGCVVAPDAPTVSRPTSPTELQTAGLTISPKSKPHGMAQFID